MPHHTEQVRWGLIMPSGVYIRTEEIKSKISQGHKKLHKVKSYGFQKENTYWQHPECIKSRFGKENKPSNYKYGVGNYSITKNLVLKNYGNELPKCVDCGFNDVRCLEIDHINNDGAKERKKIFGNSKMAGGAFYRWLIKNNYPKGYQVLCKNCNWLKYLKTRTRS